MSRRVVTGATGRRMSSKGAGRRVAGTEPRRVHADEVIERSLSVGCDPYRLDGPVSGCTRFRDLIPEGAATLYFCMNGMPGERASATELGWGRLVRDGEDWFITRNVLNSSNDDRPVWWSKRDARRLLSIPCPKMALLMLAQMGGEASELWLDQSREVGGAVLRWAVDGVDLPVIYLPSDGTRIQLVQRPVVAEV